MMDDNHYVTAALHIVRYNENDGKIYSTVESYFNLLSPMAFNWFLENSYGYVCDFLASEEDTKTTVPIRGVALIGKFLNQGDGIINYVSVFEIMVNEINTYGIGGYKLQYSLFDTSMCSLLLEKFIMKEKPIALFSFDDNTDSDGCIKIIQKYLNDYPEMLLFQLAEQTELICENYTFFSLDHISFYIPVLDVITSRLYDEIIIVTNENNQKAQLSFQYLKQNYGIIGNGVFIEYNESTTSQQLSKYLYSYSTKICILFYGTSSGFKLLMETMKEESFTEPNYHIIIMDPTTDIESLGYNNYERVLYYNADDNSLYTEFKQLLHDRTGRFLFICDATVRLYSTMNVWKLAVESIVQEINPDGELVADISRNTVVKAIINTTYHSVEGIVEYGNNHYLKRYLNILWYNEEYKFVSIFDGDNGIEMLAYFDEERDGIIKVCDLANPSQNGRILETETVAIVLSMSGNYKEIEQPLFEALHEGIDFINKNGLLLDHYIIYKLYNAGSNDEDYVSILTDLKSMNYRFIFGGFRASTLEMIGDIFSDTKKTLFYVGTSLGNCYSRNTIITHVHPSQIAQAVINRLLSLSYSAFIVQTANDYCNAIAKYLNLRMTGLSMRILGNVVVTDAARAIKIIKRALPNGGHIVTILSTKEDLITFYREMCKTGMKYPEYIIINSLFDENMKYILNDNECIYGSIVLDSYFESIGNKSLNNIEVPSLAPSFNVAFHNRIGDYNKKITGSQAAAYDAIILWRGLVIKRNSFDIINSNDIYHYTVNTPSGLIELDSNNYLMRRVYGGRINEKGEIIIDWLPLAIIEADVYDKYNISEIGYYCKLSDPKKGKKYFSNPYKLVFVHESDYGGKTDRYSQLLTDLVVTEINNKGGVLGRTLASYHFWTTSSNAYRDLRSIIEKTNSQVIFGCVTPECSKEISKYVYGKNELYFYTGRDDGLYSQRNMIVSCSSFGQKIYILKQYLLQLNFKYVVVIGSYKNSTSTYNYLVDKSLNDTDIIIVDRINSQANNEEELSSFLETIYKKLKNLHIDKIAIIDLFTTSENQVFLSVFSKNRNLANLTSLFVMGYDPADLNDGIISNLNGEFVVTSYSVKRASTISHSFSYIMNSNFPNLNEISELNENIYSSIYQWIQAVEYSTEYTKEEWPGQDYVELSLKNINCEGPSGNIKIQSNNRASKNVFIYRISGNKLEQVYPALVINDLVISNNTYDNNVVYTKNKVIYGVDLFYVLVAVVFSIVNIILCICTLSLIYHFRHSKVIKNESLLFLAYSIVSLMILAVTGDMFVVPPSNKVVCAIRVWFLSLSVDLIFSIMFTKAWRINKLFNNKKLEKIKISNKMLLKIIGLILLIQIIYLALWWIIEPSNPILTYTANHSTYLDDVFFRQCSTSLPFVIIEFILVFVMFGGGVKLAWGLRTASSEFNDSMSLLSIIVIMSIYIYYLL